ncbi:MAG: NADH-quinone oxidoreductase subunit NuoN [Sphingomonadales bacterium]
MTVFPVPALSPALPEILVAIGAMALLMYGVFKGEQSSRSVLWFSVAVAAIAFLFVLGAPGERTLTFDSMFVVDPFSSFMKLMILLGSGMVLAMSAGYIESERMKRFEYPLLLLLATLGMLMMVSANDLLSMYLGIELQSLALYVLAAFKRDSLRATESGLKYFVLGALSSGMLLYGCSLIYGFTGSTNFNVIADAVAGPAGGVSIGIILGLVFIIAGLAFKVSAVPFHMWTPDVYEGAPTPVTAFFAVAPKIAALGLFVRIMMTAFPEITDQWRQIIIFLSIASMVLGAIAAIAQTNIKRLMAYSSIGHMGYALVGLAAGTPEGVRGVLIYLAIYLAMNVGTFVCILSMRRKEGMVEHIDDLAGLSRTRPGMAAALAIFMFSLAGIPPLAGFYGKLYVFMAAVHVQLYALAIIGLLASVVSAFYYLRIIKIMYFDEPAPDFEKPLPRAMGLILSATALFTLLFFVYPSPLVTGAKAAAGALFP